jgi:hypothetical protein
MYFEIMTRDWTRLRRVLLYGPLLLDCQTLDLMLFILTAGKVILMTMQVSDAKTG